MRTFCLVKTFILKFQYLLLYFIKREVIVKSIISNSHSKCNSSQKDMFLFFSYILSTEGILFDNLFFFQP
jgi:hypothetical protein